MKEQARSGLLGALKARFENNMHRHQGVAWDEVLTTLEARPAALKSLAAMEASGGEPDVIGPAGQTGSLAFCDCSAESPSGRRSL